MTTTVASSTGRSNLRGASAPGGSTQGKGGQAPAPTFATVLDAVSKAAKKRPEPSGHTDKGAKGTHQKGQTIAGNGTHSLVALTEGVVAADLPVAPVDGASASLRATGTAPQASPRALRTTPSQEPLSGAGKPATPLLAQESLAQPAHESGGATAPPLSGVNAQKPPGEVPGKAASQVTRLVAGPDRAPSHTTGNKAPPAAAKPPLGRSAQAGTATEPASPEASPSALAGTQPTSEATAGTGGGLAGRTVTGAQPRSATQVPATFATPSYRPGTIGSATPYKIATAPPANGARGHLTDTGGPPQAGAGRAAQDRTQAPVALSGGTAPPPEKGPGPEGAGVPTGQMAAQAGHLHSAAGAPDAVAGAQPRSATQVPATFATPSYRPGAIGSATPYKIATSISAAPAAPSLSAPSQQPVPLSHVGQQVGSAVAQRLAQLPPPGRSLDGTWSLSVQLDPPELGKVDAVLSLGASGLNIALTPSTPVAQQALQQASQQIAQNIGGNVNVFVHTGGHGGTGGGQQDPSWATSRRLPASHGGDAGDAPPSAPGRSTTNGTYMLV